MGVDAEMFIRTRYPFTREELREWHYRFGMAFHEHLWAYGTHDNKVPENLYLWEVDRYEQDGDDIEPLPGERFLRINPTSRYYGPGYERGDFPTLKAIAEFLELLIPQSEIWYGGDSSGICAERFGPTEREEMLRYWVQYQHRPYLDSDGRRGLGGGSVRPICPYCQRECPQHGFGASYASFTCLGCGWMRVENSGKVKQGWRLEGL